MTVGCGCDYCEGRGNRRDFRHGKVDENDFVDILPRRKATAKKPKPKKKRGCPGNDFGPHVYVWIPYTTGVYDNADQFFKENGFHKREALVCAGCNVRKKTRLTEKMQKKINKVGWYKANYGDN